MAIEFVYQFVAVGLITAFAGFVYSAVGFGFAMLSVPAMLWLDVSLPQALVVVNIAHLAQGLTVTHHIRRDVDWRALAPLLGIALVTMACGVLVLRHMTDLPRDRIRQMVGAFVLAVVAVQWLWKVQPHRELHLAWGVLAFSCAGFFVGLLAIGGPPVVLWAMAHPWPNERIRATLWSAFLVYVPFHMAMLLASYRGDMISMTLTATAFAPTTIIGSMVGMRVGRNMPQRVLRRFAFSLLFVLAVSAMLGPLL